MLNTVKLALAATVAAATGTLATFADEVAPPASSPVPAFPLALASDETNSLKDLFLAAPQQKRVTVKIQGTIADVVKWMGDSGISFVLEDQGLTSRKVTINIVDQPVDDAIAAIAEALGTGWTKRGQVYVLGTKDALAPKLWTVPAVPKVDVKGLSPQQKLKVDTEIKRAQELSKRAKESIRVTPPNVPTPPGLSEKERKEFELQMKTLREKIKNAPDVRVYTDVNTMSEKERKAFEEALKKIPDTKGFMNYREMTPAEQKKFDESMRKFEIEMRKLGDDMKVYRVPPVNDAQRKEFEKGYFQRREVPAPPKVLKTGTMEELMKSLSPDQRFKHEQQGYLKFSELSGAQKKMLGSPSGNFTISFNLNGKQLTIKSP